MLPSLVASIYIFDIAYPREAKNTLLFFEKFFFWNTRGEASTGCSNSCEWNAELGSLSGFYLFVRLALLHTLLFICN